MNTFVNVKIPNVRVRIPIIVLIVLSGSILTVTVENGTDAIAPTHNDNINGIWMDTPAIRYVTIPTAQADASASDVIAIAFLVGMPDIICPAVTSGPYPPPLIPLLNAATVPIVIIMLFLYRNLRWRLMIIIIPAIVIIIPMLAFNHLIGNAMDKHTATIAPTVLRKDNNTVVFLANLFLIKSILPQL